MKTVEERIEDARTEVRLMRARIKDIERNLDLIDFALERVVRKE